VAVQADKLGGAPAAGAAAGTKPGEQGEKPADAPGTEHQAAKGGSWWQWLLVIIAMPLLVLVSLVGALVWLLLLPLKCFCCPVGCAVQLIWNVVEWLLKAPLRAMLWASGKPWQPQKPADLKEEGKASAHKGGDKDKTPPV
jgi:hypothetical protein